MSPYYLVKLYLAEQKAKIYEKNCNHVDEIEKYVKTLLDEIRGESKFSKEKGQLTK
ncbi:MAG: hypothetical protein LBH67_02320 [Rickettsia sp.]|jgi:hypothetical protein|nr:hypothetical protein [Rickettsia sp.]